tara:strand:+ start:356 stop:595 length:240 start_codon:yes stop_codon:yes gene_type:complete
MKAAKKVLRTLADSPRATLSKIDPHCHLSGTVTGASGCVGAQRLRGHMPCLVVFDLSAAVCLVERQRWLAGPKQYFNER